MTILSLITAVCDEIGFAAPTTVVSNTTDRTAVQMLALANRGGKQLAKRGKGVGGWSVLQTEHTFSTVASTAEYALPSDFDFFVDSGTLWNRSDYWQLRGPLNASQWQLYKSGIVSTGPRQRIRIKPSASSNVKAFFIDPTPDAADTMVYEYVSLNWCQSSGGTGAAAWAADTDTGILDEYLLGMDLKWRFLSAKGLSYAEEKREFELELAQALARDGGSSVLNLAGNGDTALMDERNIPDVGYGV